MERYFFWKALVKSILQQVFIIPAATLYYKIRLRKKGVYNLIICSHIGDFLYTMGYVRAFQKKNNIKRLRIVSEERFRELIQLYPQINCEYYAISKNWLHILCIASRYISGQQLFSSWKDCCIVEPANGFVLGFDYAKRFSGMNLKSCICQGTLRLHPGSKFDVPKKASVSVQTGSRATNAGKKGSFNGKILLCPYAQAIHYANTEQLFGRLAARLRAENYEVYINAPKGQQIAIDGKTMRISLKELYEQLGQYQAVIGIRSGLLDLAVFSGCRVTALYPPSYDLSAFYDLRHAGGDTRKIFQYRLTDDIRKDIKMIVSAQHISVVRQKAADVS